MLHIYDISSLRVNDLTFILLTWRKWLAPNNASREQMGFNSAFKGLKTASLSVIIRLVVGVGEEEEIHDDRQCPK